MVQLKWLVQFNDPQWYLQLINPWWCAQYHQNKTWWGWKNAQYNNQWKECKNWNNWNNVVMLYKAVVWVLLQKIKVKVVFWIHLKTFLASAKLNNLNVKFSPKCLNQFLPRHQSHHWTIIYNHKHQPILIKNKTKHSQLLKKWNMILWI